MAGLSDETKELLDELFYEEPKVIASKVVEVTTEGARPGSERLLDRVYNGQAFVIGEAA